MNSARQLSKAPGTLMHVQTSVGIGRQLRVRIPNCALGRRLHSGVCCKRSQKRPPALHCRTPPHGPNTTNVQWRR